MLRNIKEPYKYEKRYFVGKIHYHFSPSFSCFLPDVSAGYCQRVLADGSRMIIIIIIITQVETHNRSVMVTVLRTPCAIPPRNSNSRNDVASANVVNYTLEPATNKTGPLTLHIAYKDHFE
jgi:hypothetical protein